MPRLPKEKGKYTSFSHCWIYSGGFHQLWWIDSKPTIYKTLQGFKQEKSLYDGVIFTLAWVARITM